MRITPVFTGLEYIAFRAFGVGTWQARTVPVASGLLLRGTPGATSDNALIRAVKRVYAPVLDLSLRFPALVAGASAATDDLKRAVADARIRRAQVLVEMEAEWAELSKSMPTMIAAMDKKITAQRGRAPQGMTADAWKQTIAEYDAARDAWSRAATEMSNKTFEATVLAARDAKAKVVAIMETLGVKAT